VTTDEKWVLTKFGISDILILQKRYWEGGTFIFFVQFQQIAQRNETITQNEPNLPQNHCRCACFADASFRGRLLGTEGAGGDHGRGIR
jgi:hypothetical protein